ncbi:MAG: thermonuclease family protein, partial [Parvibaculum sp.]
VPEIANKYRRNSLIASSILLALLHFDITVKSVAAQGLQLDGLDQQAIIIILMLVTAYQALQYFLIYLENGYTVQMPELSRLRTHLRLYGLRSERDRLDPNAEYKSEGERDEGQKPQKFEAFDLADQALQKATRVLKLLFYIRHNFFIVILPVLMCLTSIAWGSFALWSIQNAGPAPLPRFVVTDGDTIRAGDERIRIIGIDTPELGKHARCAAEQNAAEKASDFLASALETGNVTITRQGKDRFDRTLAYVHINGRDIAETMIDLGLGRPYMGGRRNGWCETIPPART